MFRYVRETSAVAPRDYYIYIILADSVCFFITAWAWSSFSNDV